MVGPDGLPAYLTPTLTTYAQQSPVIDRGDPASSFSNEQQPNGGYVNLVAYGNTSQASESPLHYVLITTPAGGETWPEEQTFSIDWRFDPSSPTDSVTIDLLPADGTTPLLTIASGVPDTTYSWTLPDSIAPAVTRFRSFVPTRPIDRR